MMNLGDFAAGATVELKWNAFSGLGGSITRATNGSIRVYKGHSDTQRSSAAGITDTEDFDSLTGLNHVQIDLSDNTDAGFYAAGSEYQIVLQGAVIDGQTVNAVLAHFSIERAGGVAAILARLPAALVSGRMDASVGAMAANVMTAAAAAGDLTTELQSGLATATALATADGKLDAIGAKTTNLPSDPADQSLIIAATDALATLIGDVPTNAELATALAASDDPVLAQIALVKAKTDSLTFTQAGAVDANITHVNETAIAGNGETGTEFGPA